MKNRYYLILIVILSVFLNGCSTTPLKPGKSVTKIGADTYDLSQSENPNAPSTQNFNYEVSKGLTIPKDSIITSTDITDRGTNTLNIQLSQDTQLKSTEIKKVNTEIGSAQKDTAREIGAKLKSLSILIYVGIFLFIGGLVTLFWPPAKLLIGSTTTSIAFIVGGVLLMALPSLIVGNELLIGGIILGGVGIYFFAHRYASRDTKAKIYKELIDKNNNKIDDRVDVIIDKINVSTIKAEIDKLVKEGEDFPDNRILIQETARRRLEQLGLK